ncbi:glycosyltransferase family A protein, partial [Hominenteromicrobium sp.]
MEKPLVTLLLPCYNCEKTLDRFMRSVISESYRPLELICIDDGSTDDTAKLLKNFETILKESGVQYTVLTQENIGLGGAIQTGLLHAHGDFLCWADPDDFLLPGSVEKRATYLLQHPACGAVSSDAFVFDESDLKMPLYREAARFSHRFELMQFWYLLRGEGMVCAGCHMIRMRCFDEAVPNRMIYPARRGQNYQLMLPVCYKFPHAFLDESLYGYVKYQNGMSAGDVTETDKLRRIAEHETILLQTAKQIKMPEAEYQKCLDEIEKRYALQRFYTAIDFRNKVLLQEQYAILKKHGAVTRDIKKLYRR